MSKLILRGPSQPIHTSLNIGGSKSISNRVLLIRALSGHNFNIENLSNSDDSKTMDKLLKSQDVNTFDCHHAGTTFRFLTAFLALRQGEQILTGSSRMKQRPIGPLVDALRAIGAQIEYEENEGYPPLKIGSFKKQSTHKITIKADISSQFISALCMVAPTLEQGLEISFKGDLVSKPYLDMTLSIMSTFGITSSFESGKISIPPQSYIGKDYLVESDWSSASYHFANASLLPGSEIILNHYFPNSLQGDSAIVDMTKAFGLETEFEGSQLIIKSIESQNKHYAYNYIKQPDIAQTIAVMGAGKNMTLAFSGLKTLRIKETDRIAALQNELSKVGITLKESNNTNYEFEQEGIIKMQNPVFKTYQDHRMAMAFAPLAILGPIEIENPEVVSKSYPDFWEHLEQSGFTVSFDRIQI